MKIVALTGGIGSGKSTVAKMFLKLGIPVYDSDKEAKKLLNTSKRLKKKLISLLGEEAYSGKKLNKTYVADKIFNNRKLLSAMNELVHPAVRTHFLKWAHEQKAPYVIQEAALIFESENQHSYDKIILVTAPKESRIQRVMKRDGASEKQVLTRMQNQLGDTEKIALSDFIISNNEIDKTYEKVLSIHSSLLEYS